MFPLVFYVSQKWPEIPDFAILFSFIVCFDESLINEWEINLKTTYTYLQCDIYVYLYLISTLIKTFDLYTLEDGSIILKLYLQTPIVETNLILNTNLYVYVSQKILLKTIACKFATVYTLETLKILDSGTNF